MSRWSDIYYQEIVKAGSLRSFVLYKMGYKKRLVKTIRRYTKKSGKILEIGCGSGASLAFLGSLGYSVSGIDSDFDMIKMAREVANFSNNPIDLRVADLMKIPADMGFFDLIFSNGVLEHLTDDKIAEAIKYFLSRSRVVIFSVPTDYYSDTQKIYGDERFLSLKHWEKIIKASGAQCLGNFGFQFESIYVEAIYNLMGKLLPIKPPFVGFILRNQAVSQF